MVLNRNVILVGPQGCGKTKTGELLADELSTHFCDLDDSFPSIYGVGIGTMLNDYSKKDEPNLARYLESRLLEKELAIEGQPIVIGSGGGLVRPTGANIKPFDLELLTLQNARLLENPIVVYLQSHPSLKQTATINWGRIKSKDEDSSHRISFGGNEWESFKQMIKDRHPYYVNVADITAYGTQNGEDLSIEEVAQDILIQMREKEYI